MTRRPASALCAVALSGFLATPAAAQQPISLQDSFPIGTGGIVTCTAQVVTADPALVDMFDRGYSVVCRDASAPVGRIYALRERGGDPAGRIAALRNQRAACQPAAAEDVEGLGSVATLSCRLTGVDVAYKVYLLPRGRTLYVAEGLAGYDSALQLGLRSVVANRPVEGEVSVATTGAGDSAAFARVQAGSISRERALAEAYRRNNAGDYAEAAEFFATLGGDTETATRAEALANEALQKSNLGKHGEADALFGQAEGLVRGDPVVARQIRNYRAMHLLNQGRPAQALAELERPMRDAMAAGSAAVAELVIDSATADQLSAETPSSRKLGGSEGLTPRDKAEILDAQALQIRGSTLRLQNRAAEAEGALRAAERQLVAVRGGRVAASVWMRGQIIAELAGIAEARGDAAEAERQHRAAIRLVEVNYPGSSALMSARARLAGFLARTGRSPDALAIYREIVDVNAEAGSATPSMRRILAGYFDLLIDQPPTAETVSDMFRASQLLIRPGVAQTQAVLARELSGGSDEAARLFRQSVNLSREVERLTVELSRLQALESGAEAGRIAELQALLERARAEQVATQARLAEFPRYRVVSNAVIGVDDVRALLRPGEAYYKMFVVGSDAYAVLITPAATRAFRLDLSPAELARRVDTLRQSISSLQEGLQVTYAFDVPLAHQLYRSLFGPVSAELADVRHLVFEPDGAMLRLPPNLLITDEASVTRYQARAAASLDDEFDFRGIAWLGRERDVSTSVSVRAFRDVRQAPPSRARAQYIGFGQNAPLDPQTIARAGTRATTAGEDCSWPLLAWNQPISAAELLSVRQALGNRGAGEVVTGAAFTDEAIETRSDLSEYRIIHFATHGLLVPPRPQCPARPALLTSFGGQDSDGLLSFREIFDLRLDADLVILSACDTAGQASFVATREAGLTTGGDLAFDGLVRAFVGAGGRLVIASHWPVPDDFDATRRLITGMFAAPPGSGTAAALRAAQLPLMDALETSHPFYWSAFAVVGDGAMPMIREGAVETASAD